jgi:hypothetical protein
MDLGEAMEQLDGWPGAASSRFTPSRTSLQRALPFPLLR